MYQYKPNEIESGNSISNEIFLELYSIRSTHKILEKSYFFKNNSFMRPRGNYLFFKLLEN